MHIHMHIRMRTKHLCTRCLQGLACRGRHAHQYMYAEMRIVATSMVVTSGNRVLEQKIHVNLNKT